MSALWMHGGSGADHLVTYRAMPAEELRGGEQCAGQTGSESAHAKALAKRIVESLRLTDQYEGTNYASNLLQDHIFESDEPKWCRARRELIEKAAMHNQGPRFGCADRRLYSHTGSPMGRPGSNLVGGDLRRVQFAERRDVVNFHQDAPVVSGGSVELRGVLLDAVAPVVFAAGASNCKSDPGFHWKPGGSGGPDGMGYCPQDYEPGTVLPGFDGGLYKVAVGLDGTRVWTSAGDAAITYRVVQRPKGADGMGLLDGVGLGDYDTYSWPAHVPRAWTSYGYRRNCNAYSFLPNRMHHSILRYLVDGRLDRSGSSTGSTGAGIGKAAAEALIGLLTSYTAALALVSGGAGVMFNKDRAYLGGLKPADAATAAAPSSAAPAPAPAAAAASGAAAAPAAAAASGAATAPSAAATTTAAAVPVATTYEPDGGGILASSTVWFVGTFAKASKWTDLKGGVQSFTGWKLEVDTNGDSVTATHGTADEGAFTAGTGAPVVKVEKKNKLTSVPKVEGATVDIGAQTAYFAGDKSGYAFELRRLDSADANKADATIWLRIGKGGAKAVQEGWLCKVSSTGTSSETGVAVKFKLDGNGRTQETHLYAGHVDEFGMPSGLGVLQQVGASNVVSTEQCGEFRLGQLVLGACGAKEEGFFLDGALYGDAKFRDAAFTEARIRAVAAKKHVREKNDEFKQALPAFNAAVNPLKLSLQGGARAASRHPAASRSLRDAPVPQDDMAMFGGDLNSLPVEVKGAPAGMHFAGGVHAPSHPQPGGQHSGPTAEHVAVDAAAGRGAASIPGPIAVAPEHVQQGNQLRQGQVGYDMKSRVFEAQKGLLGVPTGTADAKLVAELQKFAELLLSKGEIFVTMEEGLSPIIATGASAEDAEKRKAELLELIRDVLNPCGTLVQHKDSPHEWVRKYVHMLSLKIIALVQYICTSERPGIAELCRIREAVETCLAFALQ